MPPYKKFYILPGTIARTYVSLNSKNNILYICPINIRKIVS
jgi:hypothetical protein